MVLLFVRPCQALTFVLGLEVRLKTQDSRPKTELSYRPPPPPFGGAGSGVPPPFLERLR